MTQQVGSPLPVSPAGAVLIGGLSPWSRSLVPRCWSSLDHQTQPEAAERTGAGSEAPLPQPEPAGRTGAGSQPAASRPPGCNARTRGISCAYPVLLHHPDPGLL